MNQKLYNFLLKKNPIVKTLIEAIEDAGGQPIMVGGIVRDIIIYSDIGLPKHYDPDFDIEVHGITVETLEKTLNNVCQLVDNVKISLVGKCFAVYKVAHKHEGTITWVDVSLPRIETSTGIGHKDFNVVSDPFVGFEKASQRRDFNMNALGWHKGILDYRGGVQDIKDKVVSVYNRSNLNTIDMGVKHFSEDPLRILRGIYLACRLKFGVDRHTFAAMIKYRARMKTIAQERIAAALDKIFENFHPFCIPVLYGFGHALFDIFCCVVSMHNMFFISKNKRPTYMFARLVNKKINSKINRQNARSLGLVGKGVKKQCYTKKISSVDEIYLMIKNFKYVNLSELSAIYYVYCFVTKRKTSIKNPNYSLIVNNKNFKECSNLLKHAKILSKIAKPKYYKHLLESVNIN